MSASDINTNKSIIRVAVVTGLILLVPFLAMQFDWRLPDPGSSQSDRVNWSLGDFVVMGSLLMGAGLTYELGIKKIGNKPRRAMLAIALLLAFLLIWAELAVGVFGSPFAGS